MRRFLAVSLSVVLVALLPFSVTGAEIRKDDPRRDILNLPGELSAASPYSQDLSAYIDELLPSIVTEDMDYFEQIKACFDYVRDNTSYGTHYTQANMNTRLGLTTIGSIYRKHGEVEGFGAVALLNRVGMCNAYASAFILLARKIGFNAYLVKGATKGGGGAYVYHEWCEIKISDEIYVFDPQLDSNLARSGLGSHKVFCVTYEQIPGRYVKY